MTDDIITNKASNPLRRATSFYDFSQLDGNGNGSTAPNVPQSAGGKPNNNETGGEGNATPANNGTGTAGNAPAGSAASSATKTTTTTTVQGNPYAQFRGNNYEDLEKFLRERMNEIPFESKADRVKRERLEKHRGFLARLADGVGTFHTAFAHARGEKAMEMPQMSKRMTELFEKQKAARDKNRDQWVNYALTLGNLKDKDRDFNLKVTQAEQKEAREAEEHGWKKEKQPYELKEAQGKATTAEEKAKTATAEAENAPELYKARVETEKARGKAQKAAAANSYASAAAHKASANKTNTEAGQGFPWWEKKDKMHLAKTAEEAWYRQTQSHGPIMDVTDDVEDGTTETPIIHRGRPTGETKITSTHKTKIRQVPMKPGGKADLGVKWK